MAAAAAQKSAPALDPDAAAYIARFTVEPDSVRKNAINDLFIAVKTAGVFAKLNVLLVSKKGQDTQSACLDLKRSVSASIVGSHTWDAADGFVGSADANSYIDTNYTPSTDASGGVTANNIGFGCYLSGQAAVSPSSSTCAAVTARGSTALRRSALRVFGNDVGNRIIGAYINGSSHTASETTLNSNPWFYQINRGASNSMQVFRSGALGGSNTTDDAGRALCDATVRLLCNDTNGTTGSLGKVAAGWVGEPLTSGEQSALETALDNYFSAL